MKVEILLLLVYLTSTKKADPIKAPLTIIGYDDISPVEREHLAYLEHMSRQRAKRSGHSLLSILGNGLKSKLSSFAKASASSSAHFSSSSSGGHYNHEHDDHHDDHEYEHKAFDFWSLNKSILNTLLQAVKAIKGATIALTGKLIKGSGYLVSAKGKLISHGGDAVTNLGKKIATSAILSPVAHGSHSSSYSEHPHEEYHSEYGPSSHQEPEGSPSALAEEYNTGPDLPNKYLPSKYSNYEGDKNALYNQMPEGIIILKKIPRGHNIQAEESQNVPDFKPLNPQTPSYKEILGGLLASASNSNSDSSRHKNPPANNPNSDLPVEHKSPTSTNYLQYFKNKPAPLPTMAPIKVYDLENSQPQVGDLQADYSNFNIPATSYQSFSSETFLPEFDTIPMETNPEFISEFSQAPNTLGTFPQFHDPRSLSKIKGPFLPTPLTNLDISLKPPTIQKVLPKRPNIDVIKSLTYELRPNGPVKI